jgi:hypothetical protein
MARDLEKFAEAARSVMRREPERTTRISAAPPKSMARHIDPDGRYEIHYPSTWSVSNVGAFFVRSRDIGSFARVDVVETAADVWATVVAGLEKAGATVTLKGRPVPSRVHGELELSGTRFLWDALAYAIQDGSVVLSLGNVVDASRSRAIETYEDRILAAIRRHFRALKPPVV